MSYCHMIAPILSYKVCSSVSSLFPVCNCGLILYRKKDVMTRLINVWKKSIVGIIKDFRSGNSFGIWKHYSSLRSAKNMEKKYTTRQRSNNALFPHNAALESLSVTINSSRGSPTESLYIPSPSSSLIYYAAEGGNRAGRLGRTTAGRCEAPPAGLRPAAPPPPRIKYGDGWVKEKLPSGMPVIIICVCLA